MNAKGQTWNANIWTVTTDKVRSKEAELATYWSGTVGRFINIQSNLAFSDINCNRRLELSPRSPCAGVAIGLLKTPRTQLKKQAKMAQHWHLSETHSKSQRFHILNTDVTWLNTHSTTALDTGMQRQDKAYASTSELSGVRMPIVLPMQK